MNCPSCKKPLDIEVVDDRDSGIAMAYIACPECPGISVILTWPKRDKDGVIVVTESLAGELI